MNKLSTTFEHESTNVTARAAKIAGGAALSGLVAYGLARGVDLLIPINLTEVFETVSARAGVVLGTALTALATES